MRLKGFDAAPRLTDLQRSHLERVWPEVQLIAISYARRFPRIPCDWESEIALGLCKAIADPRWTDSGWSFLRRHARNACIQALRDYQPAGVSRSPKPNRFAKAKAIHFSDLPVNSRVWQALSSRSHENKIDSRDELVSLTGLLPPSHRSVFLSHYLDGLSYSEIAEQQNLSEAKVGRIVRRSLLTLWTKTSSVAA